MKPRRKIEETLSVETLKKLYDLYDLDKLGYVLIARRLNLSVAVVRNRLAKRKRAFMQELV